ncbi:MAG: hypothetical protein ABIG37_02360 [Nanoarchaeota archaeon]|nr:hypothetical protein [Nanoarchaeota archaeon]
MPKKKIKIISEKVKTPFKEIKKDSEDTEDLEEEIEESPEEYGDREDFQDFSSERTALVLSDASPGQTQTPRQTEPLEKELENVQGSGKQEGGVYNMPDYGANSNKNYEEKEERKIQVGVNDKPNFFNNKNTIDLNQTARQMPQETNFSQRSQKEEMARKYKEVEIRERGEEERRGLFKKDKRKII